MDGIINLNKPGGMTSRECVDAVRKLVPGVKTGHSGTLDPAATGVLPICLGRATRIIEFIMDRPKGYLAGVQLGATTDTEDASGNILREFPVPELNREEFQSVLEKLTGPLEQVPPAYSAIKHRGRPLYYWTRRGIAVERKPRTVTIYKLELLQDNPTGRPHLILEAECSRGTYIRTLAAEIGRIIGCGAYLWCLKRTFVGCFTLEESLTLEALKSAALHGEFKRHLIPMDRALLHLPSLTLAQNDILHLKQGRSVVARQVESVNEAEITASPLRIYDPAGRFQALARWESAGDTALLKTVKYLSNNEGEHRNGTD